MLDPDWFDLDTNPTSSLKDKVLIILAVIVILGLGMVTLLPWFFM